jgi:hypothetical protein
MEVDDAASGLAAKAAAAGATAEVAPGVNNASTASELRERGSGAADGIREPVGSDVAAAALRLRRQASTGSVVGFGPGAVSGSKAVRPLSSGVSPLPSQLVTASSTIQHASSDASAAFPSAAATGAAPPSAASGPGGLLALVLDQLGVVAEERIRDARAAKLLLGSLIRAIKAAHREQGATRASIAAAVPAARILRRLCYFANARDTSIRSATLRAVRHVVTDADTAALVCQEVRGLCRGTVRAPCPGESPACHQHVAPHTPYAAPTHHRSCVLLAALGAVAGALAGT